MERPGSIQSMMAYPSAWDRPWTALWRKWGLELSLGAVAVGMGEKETMDTALLTFRTQNSGFWIIICPVFVTFWIQSTQNPIWSGSVFDKTLLICLLEPAKCWVFLIKPAFALKIAAFCCQQRLNQEKNAGNYLKTWVWGAECGALEFPSRVSLEMKRLR